MLTESDMMIIRIQDTLDIHMYAGGIGSLEEVDDELAVIRSIMVRLTKDSVFRNQNRDLYARAEDRFNKMFKVLLMRRENLMLCLV
jgi:hypothetical protein